MWDSAINLGKNLTALQKGKEDEEKGRNNLPSVIFLICTDTFRGVYVYAFPSG